MKKYLILLILVPLVIYPFGAKVRVECKTQYGECPVEINSRLQTLNSKSMFVAKREAKKILEESFLVMDFSVQFKLPNVLEANLLIKKPAFVMRSRASGEAIAVDSGGKVISQNAASSLPTVVMAGDLPEVGSDVSGENLLALKLVAGVFAMYQVQEGEIRNASLVVELPGSLRVIFPLEGDAEIMLGSLRLIYTKIQNDYAGRFSEIDLRFKNPVLR